VINNPKTAYLVSPTRRSAKIGSVDEESTATGASDLVVDTGFWIFGKKVVMPASTIGRPTGKKVCLARTKE
jgi:hypothetical protein